MRAVIAAPSRRRVPDPRLVMAVVVAVAALGSLDLSLVGTAAPFIGSDGEQEFLDQSWVLFATAVPLGLLVLPSLARAERVGRRRVLRLGLAGFVLGGAVAAVAPTAAVLLAARVLQGSIGLGVAASLAVAAAVADPGPRATRVGLWAVGGAAGLGLGPVLAGPLVEVAGWRSVFVLEVVLGAVTFAVAGRVLVPSRATTRPPAPDVGSALLVIAAVLALAGGVGVLVSEGRGAAGGVLLAVGLVLAVLFWRRWRRVRVAYPLVAEGVVASRSFRAALFAAFAAGGALAASLLTALYYVAEVWGHSPLQVGLSAAPLLLAVVPVGVVLRLVGTRRGHRVLLVAGGVAWAAALAWVAVAAPSEEQLWSVWVPALTVQGAGIGLVLTTLSMASLARTQRAAGYALPVAGTAAARQVGVAAGLLLLVVAFGPAEPETADILARGWAVAGAFALGVVAVAVLLGRGVIDAPLVHRPPTPDLSRLDRRAPAVLPPATVPEPEPDFDPLAELPLFAGMDAPRRDRLRASSRTVTVRAGEYLYRTGDPSDALYVVRSGRLVAEQDGAQLAELERGRVVGELGLLAGTPRHASVRAVRDSTLLRIDAEDVGDLADVTFMTGLAIGLARRLQEVRPVAPPRSERDAVVCLVGLDAHAPVEAVARALATELGRHVSVAAPGRVDPAALEAAERAVEHVVLAAAADAGDWRDFCLRVADRLVLVTARPAAPGLLPERARGADLVVVDAVPTNAEWGQWEESIRPESTHCVATDGLERDIRPLADRIAGRSLGIALGGGGARGLAHIGVLEVLEEAGVRIDRVSGTSIGALIGALFAAGLTAAQVDAVAYEAAVRQNPLGDWTLPRTSLIRGARAESILRQTYGDLRIEALPRQFRCVSVDLVSRRTVVHRSGLVVDAVAASMRLPGYFPPYRHPAGGLHVDGGVLDGLPVSALAGPAGPVIAVEVGQPNELAQAAASGQPLPDMGIGDTIMRTMMLASDDNSEAARRAATVYLRPDTRGAGLTEFHRLDAMRAAGREAALAALPQIATLLAR